MSKHSLSLGPRSHQYSDLPSTSKDSKVSTKRPRDDFVQSRFKFASTASQSKKLKPNLSKLVSSNDSFNLESEKKKQYDCLFTTALQNAALHNLSIPFKKLHKLIQPLTLTLPLLILHQDEVVHACCQALIVQDTDYLTTNLNSSENQLSGQTKKNREVELEKETKNKSIQAKQAVNLIATSVLDLLIPLVFDLSTSLLKPFKSIGNSDQSPFDELLVTLLYFINLSDVEPIALSKATEVIVHLFKTLAHDITPSSSDEGQNLKRLERIWRLVRNALGAPVSSSQEIQKTVKECSNVQVSELDLEDDVPEIEENTLEQSAETDEESAQVTTKKDPNEDAEIPELIIETDLDENFNQRENRTILTVSNPDKPPNSKDSNLDQLLNQVFKSTTPSSRRLVATSFAYLLRKKGLSDYLLPIVLNDLNAIEANERSIHGILCSRKQKNQSCRKGTSSRNLIGEEQGSACVFAEGISWAIAEACKSIDRRLHSRAPAIITATELHTVFLAHQNASHEHVLVSRVSNSVLVSIIHHTTAQHLELVLDSLISTTNERLVAIKSDSSSELTKKTIALETSLQCLATVTGVRDGSRLSVAKRSQIFQIVNHVLDLLSDPRFLHSTSFDSTLSFLSLNLLSSIKNHAEFLIVPEHRITVEKLFADQNHSLPLIHLYKLASTLHRLDWVCFDSFVLPQLITVISRQLAPNSPPSSTGLTASLLADLLSSRNPNLFKKLFDLISIKVDNAINVVLNRLSDFHRPAKLLPDEQVAAHSIPLQECYDWISLCAALPVEHTTVNHDRVLEWYQCVLFTPPASSTINNVGLEGMREKYISDYQSGALINQTLLLSALLELSRRSCFSGALCASTILLDNLPSIVHIWGWHRGILKFVRDLCQDARKRSSMSLSFESMYQPLKSALLSEANIIRLLTLEILLEISTPDSFLESLLKQCLKIEQTPLLVENARMRQMHVRKLSIMVNSISDLTSSDFVDLAQRILIAQLKVHFQPLWDESITALTDLNEKYHVNFWTLVWGQLHMSLHDSPELYYTPRVQMNKILNEHQDHLTLPKFSDQPEFICTHLEKLAAIFSSHLRDHSESMAFDCQHLDSRLDVQNYETQLITLLTRNHQITEKHNKLVIQAFFVFCQAREKDLDEGHLLGKSARSRLRNWLAMFSKFTNPNAFYRSQDLRGAFDDLLADADLDLRRLSLECILTWKDSSLVRQQDNLRNLLDSSQFRDTLLKLCQEFEDQSLAENDREEVVPVMTRLLFGYLVVSPGRSSAAHGKTLKRSAILSALKGFSDCELNLLVELMLRPLTSAPKIAANLASKVKKQLGFLSLLGDVMTTLGRQIIHRWEDLLNVIIDIVTECQSQIKDLTNDMNPQHGFLDCQLRKVRSQCLQRLNQFFQLSSPKFTFDRWIDSVFSIVINPKLPTFASETAQSPSALLEIVHTWSSQREFMPILIQHNPQLLTSVYQTLAIKNVKPTVVRRVIEVLENILHNLQSYPTEFTADQYLKPYFDVLLPNLAELIRKASNSYSLTASISRQQVSLLSALAPYIEETSHSETFCELILPLLSKNQVMVPDYIQADLLHLLSEFLARAPKIASSSSCFHSLSKLLGTVDTRKGRIGLVRAFRSLSLHTSEFISTRVVNILQDLNSFSTKRMDEPDFEKRLNELAQLSNQDDKSKLKFSPKEWELFVQHSLFQIRDPDELSLRGSAASVLCRFLDLAESSTISEFKLVLQTVVIPGLKKVLRTKIEIVRQEILTVMAYAAAKEFPDISELKEMRCLLVDGDKEANVLLNIYHIQVHRRIRALRRLGDESEAGHLSSKVLLDIFIPLLFHVFSPTGVSKTDPELVNEAIRTIGRITKVLNWSGYNAVLQFYVKLIHKPASVNKVTVRVVVSILKNFHFSLYNHSNPTETQELQSAPVHACNSVSAKLIPTLIKFMEQQKDDGPDESLRIMIAEGVACVATFLPENDRQTAISGIISSLSNILKSIHQETRQSARVTVGSIASLLPESFLARILKDLQVVLVRGPQLHILAHTVHTIISRISESKEFEIGSDSAQILMSVIMEDLFGQPWKDRQSKELKAKTKFNETKTSRSLETLQLFVGKLADSEILKDILISFRQLLESTSRTKALKQVDECFNRICAGIVTNKEKFDATKVLNLAHSLISQNVEYLKGKQQKKKSFVIHPTDHRIVLSVKSTNHDEHYAANAHHFVSFGLNLFHTLYRKAVFDLHSPNYLPMLDRLVSVVGNTLYTHNAEVLGRGLKVMSILIKLPLPEVERSAIIIIRQILAVVNHIGTSETEISQIALKSLAAVIRDCKKVELTEKQLTGLLKMIAPDLQDPERQNTLFLLLRSIMTKKFMAPELYDLMDQILRLLVTAQSNQVREISRSIFLQFLLDYPQGKGRLLNSLEFLVKNLAYQHESGRQSVIEILNAINMKFSVELVSKYSDLFMVALVMRVANEDSVKCKEMAIEVLRVIFKRVELEKAVKYLEMLLSWSQPNPKGPIELRRAALQLIAAVVEVVASKDDRRLEQIHHSLCVTVEKLGAGFLGEQNDGDEEEESSKTKTTEPTDWQTIYYSLEALSKVYQISSRLIFHSMDQASNFPEWNAIQRFLLFPHVWVRASAVRLIGTLLSTGGIEEDHSKFWLFEDSNLIELARKSSLQLRSKELDDSLAVQVVKNLFLLLKTIHSHLKKSNDHCRKIENLAVTDDLRESDGEDDQSDSSDDDAQGHEDHIQAVGVGCQFDRLIRKLSRQASIAHAKRPSLFATDAGRWSIEPISILRCFAALATHLSADELKVILRPLLIPIFRIIEDTNTKDSQMEELQNLAKEVQECLREKVGSTCFTKVYGQLRANAIEKRQARKKVIALKAVNQPELSAKRKISRSESKTRNKKRKQLAFSKQNALFGKSSKFSLKVNQSQI